MEIQQLENENFETLKESDLIEILWMQDIDMGVSRDTFSIRSIQKELEKDEDYELLKSKQPLDDSPITTDITSLDLPDDDDTIDDPSLTNDEITYIIDGETGELVPAPPGTVLPEPPAQAMDMDAEPQTTNPDPIQMSFEDALSILEAESRSPPERTAPTVPTATNTTLQTEIDSLVQNISQLTGLSYTRQTSIEARWNDVEGLINGEGLVKSQANINILPVTDQQKNVVLPQQSFLQTQSVIGTVEPLLQSVDNTVVPVTPQPVGQPAISQNHTILTSLLTENMETDSSSLLDLLTDGNAVQGSELMPIKIEDSDSAVGSLDSTGSASSLKDFGDGDSDVTSPFNANTAVEQTIDPFNKFDNSDPVYDFKTIQFDTSSFELANTDPNFGVTLADEQKAGESFSSLQPEQSSKESKKAQRELDKKISRSRDERKAKGLNIPISVEDIIHSPVEKFNELLTKYQLSEKQLQLIKDIRRRGKNKVAAQNCRKRKMEAIETLEECVTRMRREKQEFVQQKSGLEEQKREIQDKYSNLYKNVFRNFRDEHGNPYNPDEYTLQHTPDGNIFLVPKNSSRADDGPQLHGKKKRKNMKK